MQNAGIQFQALIPLIFPELDNYRLIGYLLSVTYKIFICKILTSFTLKTIVKRLTE